MKPRSRSFEPRRVSTYDSRSAGSRRVGSSSVKYCSSDVRHDASQAPISGAPAPSIEDIGKIGKGDPTKGLLENNGPDHSYDKVPHDPFAADLRVRVARAEALLEWMNRHLSGSDAA